METGMVSVREYGAKGDGAANDTLAIRKAMDAVPARGGVVFFPPGHYLSDTIYPHNQMTFLGHSAFGYQEPGGTIISPVQPNQARLFDLNGRVAVHLRGLTLHGRDLGAEMCGVYASRGTGGEQHVVIDGCRIEHFSGSGMAMGEAHVWCLRHSIFMSNGLDGVDAGQAFDGWINDCMFVANKRHGLSLNNSVAVSACRIEHNALAGITVNRYYGQHLQITGNLFCSEFGPAIECLEGNVRAITVTGNTFRNSGRGSAADPDRDCHVHFEGVQGLAFTGNALHILWCNNPACAMVLKNLRESVVANNTLFKSATKQLIRDLGGHRDTIIANNPGSLKDPQDLDS